MELPASLPSVNRMPGIVRAAREWLRPCVPKHLAARFRLPSPQALEAVRGALVEHWFDPSHLSTPEGKADLENHLSRRLEQDRRHVITWLDSARPLAGATILEIGCGTGSSTVALAEQGANVTALDIDEPALAVARSRLRAFDLTAELVALEATRIESHFAGQAFDFVIFYASLEHMTTEERLASLAQAWRLLPRDGLLAVVEAPNRLWYHDHHTSHLNFFFWLPDDLAAAYARHSPRPRVREADWHVKGSGKLDLARAGRGVSYHEFELAIAPIENLEVVSGLAQFERSRDPTLRWRWRYSREGRYARMLSKIEPRLHAAFFEPQLNVIVRR